MMKKFFELLVIIALFSAAAPALAVRRVPQNAPAAPLQPLPLGAAPNYSGSVNFQNQGVSSATTAAGSFNQPPAEAAQSAFASANHGQAAAAAGPLGKQSGLAWLVLIVLLGGGAAIYFYVSRNKPQG